MPDREAFPTLAIHGGAGIIKRETLDPVRENAVLAALTDITRAGQQQLAEGASALDVAQHCVRLLEDCEYFNAGRGAVLNRDAEPEFDAALMRGDDRAVGAVAAIHHCRNPIDAARAVLEQGDHVLLAGEGADAFARDSGLPQGDRDWFVIPERLAQLANAQRAGRISLDHDEQYGTVGAVARDCRGGLAAATSTGGMTNKLPGRVGDTPLPGAGTWADNAHCAISGTGHGEFLIRAQLAYDVYARMHYRGEGLTDACDASLKSFADLGGSGGLIAVPAQGPCYLPFNAPAMYRGWLNANGKVHSAIFP